MDVYVRAWENARSCTDYYRGKLSEIESEGDKEKETESEREREIEKECL